MKLKMLILILVINFLVTSYSIANDEQLVVPIEVIKESGRQPTDKEPATLTVLAPLKYNGWKLSGAAYSKGDTWIPINQYLSPEEFPGKAAFLVTGKLNLFKNSHVTVAYTPLPKKGKDGKEYVSLCIHNQEVSWGME